MVFPLRLLTVHSFQQNAAQEGGDDGVERVKGGIVRERHVRDYRFKMGKSEKEGMK